MPPAPAIVLETVPALDGAALLERLDCAGGAYLLESRGDHALARYLLAGAEPRRLLRIDGGHAELRDPSRPVARGDAWGALADIAGTPRTGAPAWPVARVVGYLAYEFGALCDRFPRLLRDGRPWPDALLAEYDAGYVCDRTSGRAWIWAENAAAARALARRLFGPRTPLPPPRLGTCLEAPASRAAYVRGVRRVLDYIAAGDIYQANIARRFTAPLAGAPAALYLALREASVAPFAAYVDLGEVQLLSMSPERFLYLDRVSGLLETRPIKGTRPRAATADGDRDAARELAASAKDRAEHVMIVDLERNDLGRVCRAGTVRVEQLARVESFAHVHHLVSVVRGELQPRADLRAVLRATFPGGSITGAPKLRAMEIIAEVEGRPRGPAFGAFGYLDAFGRVDLALAIRTAVVADGHVSYAAGGGIVADSDPDAEYDEAQLKARAFLGVHRALQAL